MVDDLFTPLFFVSDFIEPYLPDFLALGFLSRQQSLNKLIAICDYTISIKSCCSRPVQANRHKATIDELRPGQGEILQ